MHLTVCNASISRSWISCTEHLGCKHDLLWLSRIEVSVTPSKFLIAGFFDNPKVTITVWSGGIWSRVATASTKAFLFTSSLYNSDRILVVHNCSKSVSSSFESRQADDTYACFNTYSFISSWTFQGHFTDSSPSQTVTADNLSLYMHVHHENHFQGTPIDWRFIVLLQ